MDRRRNDPDYTMHEPEQPQEGERLSAEEFEEQQLARENTPQAVQERANTPRRPPSEVRETEEKHGS